MLLQATVFHTYVPFVGLEYFTSLTRLPVVSVDNAINLLGRCSFDV
jgi:hypothetical protein